MQGRRSELRPRNGEQTKPRTVARPPRDAIPNRAEERIEHCESCGGYLKTYDGQGHETLLLSDWSSLHLDLIAHDRGLNRLAASAHGECPTVLHATDAGRPIYARMGYAPISTHTLYTDATLLNTH